jgi:histidine triad (HIT) family protein
MVLTPKQVEDLKAQLSQQIQQLPEDQRVAAQKQIDSMSPEALESMLEQQRSSQNNGTETQKPIFRAIIDGEIPSKKIDENLDAIAVLEIKPISKGHVIIIPKKQVKNPINITKKTLSLAKSVSKRIISKLKAKEVKTFTPSTFGEIIINLIPIYDQPLDINSSRQETAEDELLETQQKLYKKHSKPVIKNPGRSRKNKEVIKLKRRVP